MDVTTDPPPAAELHQGRLPLGVRQRLESEKRKEKAASALAESEAPSTTESQPPPKQPSKPAIPQPAPAKSPGIALYLIVGILAGLIAVALIVSLR